MTANQSPLPAPLSRRRRVVLAALVVAVTSSVCLVLAEIVLRQFITLPLRRPAPEVRYVADTVRRFRLRPDQRAFTYGAPVVVDTRGFRTNGVAPPIDTTTSTDIFALGDSFTFGMGVKDDETWPARLEHELRDRLGRRVTIVNGGTISYGVFQELDQLQTALPALKPRVVVHALYWNDGMSASAPKPGDAPVVTNDGFLTWDDQGVRQSRARAMAGWIVTHSALLSTARKLISAARSTASDGGYGASFQKFVEHGLTAEEWRPIDAFYARFLALSREYGFEPMVVIMPVDDVVAAATPTQHAYPREARRRLAELGIPSIDAFTLWERGGHGKELFLPQGHDAHLNADGYRIIARAVADSLLGNSRTRSALARTAGR